MKSVILCEGSTDFALLQYFMREAYQWNYKDIENGYKKYLKRHCILEKEGSTLLIGGCGGCGRISPVFKKILEINNTSAKAEAFDKIVIITDRDEIGTEREFITQIEGNLISSNVSIRTGVTNDEWISGIYKNGHGRIQTVQILLLVIPFENTGAMETFLLDAIAKDNQYDDKLIKQGNKFVDSVDDEKRYLTKRRYITKAKFDVYFSIRTSVDQFTDRQNILKNVKWEQYTNIQKGFIKLGDLS